nr:hypothetical protein C03G6.1 - Caenorhabditis elegans [Caenorhabditis elegans]
MLSLNLSFLGFLANWCVFYCFIRLKEFHHSFGYLSASQALIDAIYSSTFLFYVCPMVLLKFEFTKVYSSYAGFIALLCYELSVFTHLAISFNRLTAVWMPKSYQVIFSGNNTISIILGIWVIITVMDYCLYEWSIFMFELLSYIFTPQLTNNSTVIFLGTSFCFVAIHVLDG